MKFFQPGGNGGGGGSGTVTSITAQNSVTATPNPITTSGTINLVNDATTPGNSKYYGTDSGGTKGFFTIPSATPASPNKSVQFNNSGVFGGTASFFYDNGGSGINYFSVAPTSGSSIFTLFDGGSNTSVWQQAISGSQFEKIEFNPSGDNLTLTSQHNPNQRYIQVGASSGIKFGNATQSFTFPLTYTFPTDTGKTLILDSSTGQLSWGLPTGGGTIYPSNLIPFGDGSTAGGITSPNMSYDGNQFRVTDSTGLLSIFQVGAPTSGLSVTDNINGTSSISLSSSSGMDLRFTDLLNSTVAGINADTTGLHILNNNGSSTTSWSWPTADGSAGQAMVTDGAGNLSFATVGGGTPTLTSTQVAYGDPSNLMTSSSNYIYDPVGGNYSVYLNGFAVRQLMNSTGQYIIDNGGANTTVRIRPNLGTVELGDVSGSLNGSTFEVDDTGRTINSAVGDTGFTSAFNLSSLGIVSTFHDITNSVTNTLTTGGATDQIIANSTNALSGNNTQILVDATAFNGGSNDTSGNSGFFSFTSSTSYISWASPTLNGIYQISNTGLNAEFDDSPSANTFRASTLHSSTGITSTFSDIAGGKTSQVVLNNLGNVSSFQGPSTFTTTQAIGDQTFAFNTSENTAQGFFMNLSSANGTYNWGNLGTGQNLVSFNDVTAGGSFGVSVGDTTTYSSELFAGASSAGAIFHDLSGGTNNGFIGSALGVKLTSSNTGTGSEDGLNALGGFTDIGNLANGNLTNIRVDDNTETYILNKLGGSGSGYVTVDNAGTLGFNAAANQFVLTGSVAFGDATTGAVTSNTDFLYNTSTNFFEVGFGLGDTLQLDSGSHVYQASLTDGTTFQAVNTINSGNIDSLFTDITGSRSVDSNLSATGWIATFTDSSGTPRETQISMLDQLVTIGQTVGGNGTTFTLNDSSQEVIIQGTYNSIANSQFFITDFVFGTTVIGDVSSSRNGTTITVDDISQQTTLNSAVIFHTFASGSGSITASPNDYYIDVDSTSNAATIALPPAVAGLTLVISDYLGNASLNNITIAPSLGNTIQGGASFVMLNNYQSITVHVDAGGINWVIS